MDDKKPPRIRKKLAESEFQFGGRAKVQTTLLTLAVGVAERAGVIYGQTTPSLSKVDVLGDPTDDYAVNVYFEELKLSLWFAEELLKLVEVAPKMTVTMIDGTLHAVIAEPSADSDDA